MTLLELEGNHPDEASLEDRGRMAAGCAAVAVAAPSALAALVVVKTDAGTTCTLNADKQLGSGLLRPITFTGDVECSLADPANIPTFLNGALGLNSSLVLGLGAARGAPNQTPKPAPPGFEGGYECDLAPGADCGATGTATGLPLATYNVFFGGAITAPKGETWTVVPEACELAEGTVSCASRTEPFTAN